MELLGCGFTMGTVPSFNPAAERWGMNNLMFMRYSGHFDDWTRWFDLHASSHIVHRRPDAYDWYGAQTKPIYRWALDPHHVTAVYPREAVQAFFGNETDFAGSLSWMFALAIYERFDSIDVFWCPMDDHEHGEQVPSVRYWIGQARGRGVRVRVHGDSALTPSRPMYGVSEGILA